MIQDELHNLLYALWFGVRISAAYDIILLFRRLVNHKKIIISFEDFLFAVFAGFFSFSMLFTYSEGLVRWYNTMAIMIGILAFHKILGHNLVNICVFLLQILLKSTKMKINKG